MKKLLTVALLMMFLMPMAALPAFAAEEAVDVGNKICPISGDPVSGTNFVDYQGKRYGLCCSGCKAMFLADPEKYVAKMKEQEPELSQEVVPATVSGSEDMEKAMEQGSL